MNRPLVWVLAAYIFGILFGATTSVPTPVICLVFGLVLAAAIWLARSKWPLNAPVAVFLLFLPAAALLSRAQIRPILTNPAGELVEENVRADALVHGRILRSSLAGPQDGYQTFLLHADRLGIGERSFQLDAKFWVNWSESGIVVPEGSDVVVEGRLARPYSRANPGVERFDRYAHLEGIAGKVLARGEEAVVLGTNAQGVIPRITTAIREIVFRNLDSLLPDRHRDFAATILLGERMPSRSRDAESLRFTGCGHLLAVSGLHVTFLFVAALAIFRILPISERRVYALSFAAAALFILVAGARVPAMRAGFMLLVCLAGRSLKKEYDPLNALCLAGLVLLVWNPVVLFTAGFQLSFISVFSLLVITPRIEGVLPERTPHWLSKQLATVLGITIGIWPLIAFYYSYLTLAAPFANLLIVPFGMAALALVMATGGLSLVSLHLAKPFAAAAVVLIEGIFRVSHWLASLPGIHPYWGMPSLVMMALYFLGIWALLEPAAPFGEGKRRAWRVIRWALGFFLIFTSISFYHPVNLDRLEVVFLDVGQGDAIYIEFPDRRNVLIDGGGNLFNFDAGERVIAPYLLSRGVEYIDCVVATHPDNDHMGGLEHIVENFGVGTLLLPPFGRKDPDRIKLEESGRSNEIEMREFLAGYKIHFDEGTLEFFNPIRPSEGADPDEFNDLSAVIRINYKTIRMLITADIEVKTERRLISENAPLRAEVLKAPHHGSATSSSAEFIAAVQPRLVVVTAGANNPHGHPAPDVVQRYEEAGVTVLQTGRDGAIAITTDGYSIQWETTTGRLSRKWWVVDARPTEDVSPEAVGATS